MKNLLIGTLLMVVLYFVGPPVITMIVAVVIAIGAVIGTLLPFVLGLLVIGIILWGVGKVVSCFTRKKNVL